MKLLLKDILQFFTPPPPLNLHDLQAAVCCTSRLCLLEGRIRLLPLGRLSSVIASNFFLILDIPVGMYIQKYISLLSIAQSQPTHTLAVRNQA